MQEGQARWAGKYNGRQPEPELHPGPGPHLDTGAMWDGGLAVRAWCEVGRGGRLWGLGGLKGFGESWGGSLNEER